MSENVENMYFNIGGDYSTETLKKEILEGYAKYEKIRMIYDLNDKNVSMKAMLKLKKVFEEIGVEHLEETCIICKDGLKKTLIKNFLKLVRTERPVRFI
tara:strand:+ start:83 stop:379 length:297 start_codon:yes stop_codon:yes gene_type:complete